MTYCSRPLQPFKKIWQADKEAGWRSPLLWYQNDGLEQKQNCPTSIPHQPFKLNLSPVFYDFCRRCFCHDRGCFHLGTIICH